MTQNPELIIKNLELAANLGPKTKPSNSAIKALASDNNEYAGFLAIFAYGQGAMRRRYSLVPGRAYYEVTPEGYGSLMSRLASLKLLDQLKTQTPAGKKGELVVPNYLGISSRMAPQMNLNPMTGPGVNTPCLGADLLNSIHPGMVDAIENTCNIIRTRSYLSLPPGAYGGLQSVLYQIQGAANSFMQALYDLYQGVILVMQQFAQVINGIMASVNQYIYNLISSIIPLDLICAILGAAQSLLDDVAFFASLFNGSDSLFNAINSIQKVINYASIGLNYAYNPINLLSLAPGVSDVVNAFSNLQSNPQALLGQLISNFGFSAGANNSAIQIANAILLRYGLMGQLGPLGSIMLQSGVAGNNSQWYKTSDLGTGDFGMGSGIVPPNPMYLDPDNPLAALDVNSNPYFKAFKTDIKDFTSSTGNLVNLAKDSVTDLVSPRE
jgi:hypothetical protein